MSFSANGNYGAWSVEEEDFPGMGTIEQQIRFLLQYAILAPSTFNAQPWKVKIKGDKVDIFLQRSRILEKANKSGRFAFITIGCFIKNLQLAALCFGFETKLVIKIETNDDLIKVGTLFFKKGVKKKHGKELSNIVKRATNRSMHTKKKVAQEIVNKLVSAKTSKIKLIMVSGRNIEKFIPLSVEADKEVWGDTSRRLEHSKWVRHNLTTAYDGMPAFGVGIGLVPSFFSKVMMQSPVFPLIQAKKNAKALEETDRLVVILGEDNKEAWINIGLLFEELSLSLAGYGISVAPMGTFIESEEVRKKVNETLENKLSLTPQMVFRMGYAVHGVSHSPRLPVEQILLK